MTNKSLSELNEEYDPKCRCGAVHPRNRTPTSGCAYIVATDEDRLKPDAHDEPGHINDCKWRGALCADDFEKGLKRASQATYCRVGNQGTVIWYKKVSENEPS